MMNAWNSANDIANFPEVFLQAVDDPAGKPGRREIGIIREHRFAFYLWSRWFIERRKENRSHAPVLVTIDWHQDLAPPNEQERNDLDGLDLSNEDSVIAFCRTKMNPYNDGHILSAAWRGIISDIIVVCKQKFRSLDQYRDSMGHIHLIRKFTTFDAARNELVKSDRVILDIDLDYFTESESFRGGDPDVRIDSDEEIRSILNPDSDFFRFIFRHFLGMTIATEPGFCGSIENAQHIFSILNEQIFDLPLTDPNCNWKHLHRKALE